MIKVKDVITIKIPYPDINSSLAVQSHMYICNYVSNNNYNFLKCQRFKTYMLDADYKDIISYQDEESDITRNPFNVKTRIDCDKIFITQNVSYDSSLLTKTRRDISDELYNILDKKIKSLKPREIYLCESDLVSLNQNIEYI